MNLRFNLNLIKQRVNVLKYNNYYFKRLNILKNKKIIREEKFFFVKS